jgi:hypothetical protein
LIAFESPLFAEARELLACAQISKYFCAFAYTAMKVKGKFRESNVDGMLVQLADICHKGVCDGGTTGIL